MTDEGVPRPLPPESIAAAVADAVRALGRPASAMLLRRANGKELHVVTGPGGSLVVKRAPRHSLPREAAIQRMLAERIPGSVPAVIAAVPAIDGFAMELLSAGTWTGWEAALGEGAGASAAAAVGRMAAHLHRVGTVDAELRRAAADGNAVARGYAGNVREAAALDDPAVDASIAALLDDVLARRTTVAHGDLHVGNVLIGGGRPAIVDLEQCWSGDAAYDMGKLVGLTIGLQIVNPRMFERAPMRAAVGDAFAAWQTQIDWEPAAEAGRRAVRLALALVLATARKLERRRGIERPSLPAQRAFARRMLLDGVDAIGPVIQNLIPPDPD